MAIEFSKTSFGPKTTNTANKDEQPKAQFWMNIGYAVDVPVDGGGMETRFVSLPQGIPVDTQEHLKISGKNAEWKQFQSARNGLLDQILAAAKELAPGEEQLLNLQIQLRRVNDEESDVPAGENMFARTISL